MDDRQNDQSRFRNLQTRMSLHVVKPRRGPFRQTDLLVRSTNLKASEHIMRHGQARMRLIVRLFKDSTKIKRICLNRTTIFPNPFA